MISAVVTRSLADRRRGVLGYGIGLGLMIVWVMAIYPGVEKELSDYIDAMPDTMKSLFGMEDITSLAGFVHAEIFSLMGPLVFIALAITAAAGALAGEERDRILPIVLSTGIGRGPLLLSKLAALAITLGALGALTLGSLLIGLVLAGGGFGLAAATAATVQLAALGLFFGTLTFALGATTGKKTLASGTAVGVALATYLVDALANLVGWLGPFELLSPFHWYAPGNPLVNGISITGLSLLAACTAIFAVVAVVAFDRRDVAA
ncbi:MAG TPA: ABC transporter permease subunit [Acidimicrobiia bacterium]|nr:ABC transporter permease subunit [Acidimicrobiia bacterium]